MKASSLLGARRAGAALGCAAAGAALAGACGVLVDVDTVISFLL